MSATTTDHAKYRFGDAAPVGLLLGLPARQAAPLVVGVLWLTLMLMAQLPLLGMPGPLVGAVLAFGRIRGVPLFEVTLPALRLGACRRPWTRSSLVADGDSRQPDLPEAMSGLELLEVDAGRLGADCKVAVVRDRRLDCVSLVVPVVGDGFPFASNVEQDAIVERWGAALAPLARAKSPIARLTWQEWARPVGVEAHRRYVDSVTATDTRSAARADYDELLDLQGPFTIAHEVLLTLTVELRRVRARKGMSQAESAIAALVDEARMLSDRLDTAGLGVGAPFDTASLREAIRHRSDPMRSAAGATKRRRSLAEAAQLVTAAWGPMAVKSAWHHVHVDGSFHRSYFVAHWPRLDVPADFLRPLLTADTATRTVTIVLEPVSTAKASMEANRHLTSIEADQEQKARHGFRLTARERRKRHDVEARETELAEGHPEFRFVGIVTVTAADEESLDRAAANIEQNAAQSLLELRPLAARHEHGWVASLPLGRSVRNGGWT